MQLDKIEWPFTVTVSLTQQDLELLTECFEPEAALEPESEEAPENRYRWGAACNMQTAFQSLAHLLSEAEARHDCQLAAMAEAGQPEGLPTR